MGVNVFVFDPRYAPEDKEAFVAWVDQQMAWEEDLDYNDPQTTTPALQAFIKDVVPYYPNLNGSYGPTFAQMQEKGSQDLPRSDHGIGPYAIDVDIEFPCLDEDVGYDLTDILSDAQYDHGITYMLDGGFVSFWN